MSIAFTGAATVAFIGRHLSTFTCRLGWMSGKSQLGLTPNSVAKHTTLGTLGAMEIGTMQLLVLTSSLISSLF
eukprot:2240062-Prorocentrum_lima.AAC.1